MKKIIVAILVLTMCAGLAGCGSGGTDLNKASAPEATAALDSTVIQAEFDRLKADYSKLQSEYDTLKADYNKLESEQKKLASSAAESAAASGELRAPNDGIAIHDDEYVTILFLGCEKEKDEYDPENLVFYVINKTDTEITFQAKAMALDGESLGATIGSDGIAAQSKGKIRFSTKEAFPTHDPDIISGTIRVVDFSKSIFPESKQSYDVSFTDIKTKADKKPTSTNSITSSAAAETTSFTSNPEEATKIRTKTENLCTAAFKKFKGYSYEVLANLENTGYTAILQIPISDDTATPEQIDEILGTVVGMFEDLQKDELLGEPSLKSLQASIIMNEEPVREKTVTFK